MPPASARAWRAAFGSFSTYVAALGKFTVCASFTLPTYYSHEHPRATHLPPGRHLL